MRYLVLAACNWLKVSTVSSANSGPVQVLFVDFDGVLHDANEAAFDFEAHVLLDNPRLFEHIPLLAEALAPYPELRIVVSSDWQSLFDDAALVRLLGPLGPRFSGVTEMRAQTRADSILRCAQRLKLTSWLALDDNESVVKASRTDSRFIACPSDKGISDATALRALKKRLAVVV
ncbi:HAD domain-containing protein [Uliginosibacterium sediminicola]|uniref:HAD domain-containing protein n=1 Tax=Uliginosibacterium sediminicola TaxID=2024550 RepID=A0ABU9YTH5_9RHOO